MYSLIRPLLFQCNPETMHEMTITAGQICEKIPGAIQVLNGIFGYEHKSLNVKIGNLEFPNPLGIAAGYDKNGVSIPLLQALGFGHIEVGTVTPKPQPGNPKPRLFRLIKDKAIINRMGFNNHGIDALVNSLSSVKRTVPIGINLGKNKVTPIEKAADDYMIGLDKSYAQGDYFTINISSPNTANLRSLQKEEYLYPLIKNIMDTRNKWVEKTGEFKQIWLKIAPDLTDDELKVIVEIVQELKVDALILTNTTISRPDLISEKKGEIGGLSGKPIFNLSNQILEKVSKLTEGKLPLIAVGGIYSTKDVQQKLRLGAKMVQIYTGLIYEGPAMLKKIKKELVANLS